MIKNFPPDRNFSVLSLRDLLDARDHYHVHLSHLSNVVGTAVGRYLIHENDWYATNSPATKRRTPKPKGPKTLFNTVITEWSWPCVLVFVRAWEKPSAFGTDADQMVPRALYLPDGRVIPTCTVLVQDEITVSAPDYQLSFPNSYLGGGYLTLANVQGREHMGSIACLVSDGDLTYALTNHHVTGAPGREMFTTLSGRHVRIGISDSKQLTCRKFSDIYPEWQGRNVQLQMDAGLIRIDDVADWTTQVASIGSLQEWLDFTTDTLTLDMIDESVRAFGAASGELRGRIAALFYRYSSAAGTDYVTDFLIRPRSLADPGTVHGDSGTLWFWEQLKKINSKYEIVLRPFAMQWGGHNWVENGQCKRTGRFALAAALSPICRELGVTLLRDWNTSLPQYWGAVGHYTIGYFACDDLPAKLGTLMKANQEIASYPLDSITSTTKINLRHPGGLVPLADVPDRLWAHGKMIRGSADKPNHFADMDQPDPANGNKTLLDLCKDPKNIDPTFWFNYYSRVGDTQRGCLPFRVWQFFDEMVDALKKKDIDRYVCSAGVCAHYVGDACQALHISYMFNGEPQPHGKKRGEGVHSAYEDKMLRQNSVELLNRLQAELKNPGSSVKPPTTGKEAAQRVIDLMRSTFQLIKPKDIVDAFADGRDLWQEFGDATVKVMADGVRTLRAIWLGAWNQGGGPNTSAAKLVAADEKTLIRLYMKKTWAPSMGLKNIGTVLGLGPVKATAVKNAGSKRGRSGKPKQPKHVKSGKRKKANSVRRKGVSSAKKTQRAA